MPRLLPADFLASERGPWGDPRSGWNTVPSDVCSQIESVDDGWLIVLLSSKIVLRSVSCRPSHGERAGHFAEGRARSGGNSTGRLGERAGAWRRRGDRRGRGGREKRRGLHQPAGRQEPLPAHCHFTEEVMRMTRAETCASMADFPELTLRGGVGGAIGILGSGAERRSSRGGSASFLRAASIGGS